MKRLMMIMSILVVATMVLAACSTTVEPEEVPQSSAEDTMEKDDMAEDKMDDDKDMMEEDKMDDDKDMMEEEKMDDHNDSMDDDKMEEDKMDDSMEKDDMEEDKMMNEGDMAPDLELMSVSGETVRLSDFKGEKVYVKYWASWCPICLSGLDAIDELSATDDFKVITIVTPGFKGEKDADDFKEWFSGLDTENLTVLLDVDGEYAKEFGIIGFPTSIYIGSDGVLTSVTPGHQEVVDIEAKVDSIY
jgi:thiol-disulfide isomerase/thioredoxin